MKERTNEELLDINLYLYDETRIEKEKHRIVKTRKPHMCVICKKEFPAKTKMRLDTWLNKETEEYDSLYYCVSCIENLCEEID